MWQLPLLILPLKQLLKQCDRISLDWARGGICSATAYDEEVDLVIGYDSIEKVSRASFKIRSKEDDEDWGD